MSPKDKEKKDEVEDTTEEEEVEDKTQEEETSTEEETEEEDDLSPEEIRARLKKAEQNLRETRREAKERRLALEKLQKEQKEREEAELSEVEKLKKSKDESDKAIETLRQENHALKLAQSFDEAAEELELDFASPQARRDALRLLDPEEVGEDFEGMEDALKKLSKNRPYLFGKPDPNSRQFINDGARISQGNRKTPMRKTMEAKKRRIPPL